MSQPGVEGLTELLARLKNAPQALTQAIGPELSDGAQNIAAEAKQRAPGDQGILQNEIGASKIDDLNYESFSGAEYSPFVEFGTLTKVSVPAGLEEYAAQFQGGGNVTGGSLGFKDAIYAWCQRQGIDKQYWWPIFISIATKGVRPQPFFFPAVARQTPIIIDRVKKALDNAL